MLQSMRNLRWSLLFAAGTAALWPQSANVVVRPREIHEVLVNPGMGITTFQRFNGDAINPGREWSEVGPEAKLPVPASRPDFPDTSIAYIRWFWSQIEPERGKYRWDIVDLALDQARAHHQTVAIRLMPYDERHPLPAWYQTSGARRANKPGDKDGAIWSPDSSDPLYIKSWGDVVAAAGLRYDSPSISRFRRCLNFRVLGRGLGTLSARVARTAAAHRSILRRIPAHIAADEFRRIKSARLRRTPRRRLAPGLLGRYGPSRSSNVRAHAGPLPAAGSESARAGYLAAQPRIARNLCHSALLERLGIQSHLYLRPGPALARDVHQHQSPLPFPPNGNPSSTSFRRRSDIASCCGAWNTRERFTAARWRRSACGG